MQQLIAETTEYTQGQLVEKAKTSENLNIQGKINPYNPKEIQVDALISGPEGIMTQPCFWYVPMKRSRDVNYKNGHQQYWERFQAIGSGQWRFRFSPAKAGVYHYEYQITQAGKSWKEVGGKFTVNANENFKGRVIVDSSKHYFQYKNGESFFPLGVNLAWPNNEGSASFDEWIKLFFGAGGNTVRMWMIHYFCGTSLEWTPTIANPSYKGVAFYNQESATRMDRIIESLEKNNVKMILSLFSFGSFEFDWKKNPYNKKNGGWLKRPAQFFTDKKAKQATKNLLRYIVARYGWSSNILAWEFWNEVEGVKGYKEKIDMAWHKEMAAFMKKTDIHKRLLTTSYMSLQPYHTCPANDLEDIDFVNVHTYYHQVIEDFPRKVSNLIENKKPILITEFGLSSKAKYFEADKHGLNIHDSLWAGLFSGTAGSAFPWWWEEYIAPRNLFFHWKGISAFLKNEVMTDYKIADANIEGYGELFAYALYKKNKTLAWVGSKRELSVTLNYNTVKSIQKYGTNDISGHSTLKIKGDFTGLYNIEFYDTFYGTIVGKIKARGTQDEIQMSIPAFRQDLGIKIIADSATLNEKIIKKNTSGINSLANNLEHKIRDDKQITEKRNIHIQSIGASMTKEEMYLAFLQLVMSLGTVALAYSIYLVKNGKISLHKKINMTVFILIFIGAAGLLITLAMGWSYKGIASTARMNIHRCFSTPLFFSLLYTVFTGVTGKVKQHRKSIPFTLFFWLGTLITGLWFF